MSTGKYRVRSTVTYARSKGVWWAVTSQRFEEE